ncbi:MAG: uroporphyrinogen decarboxylase [Planctomycetota bacterium]|nr:uroporphyrinogen decarboxylase [Planctomycetota bacterium]
MPDTAQPLSSDLQNSPFMKACRGEPVPYTPIWLMRQAGRYMKEYRDVRAKVSMIELCKNPDLATEVTVTARNRIGADAAIIFSDLPLILEPMGLQLTYDEGPQIHNPVRALEDIDRLRVPDTKSDMAFMSDALQQTRAELPPDIPLLGFVGAPFTLASYMIEGGGSKNYEHTKKLMLDEPDAWHRLMEKVSQPVADYMNQQLASGAQAVQIFDSWAGCMTPSMYHKYVFPHVKGIIDKVAGGIVINFATGNPALLPLLDAAGGDVIGIDYRIDLDAARKILDGKPMQGNLDPCALLAERKPLLAEAGKVLEQAGGQPGHIFNLGHGILKETPVDNVIALVDYVHEESNA